MPFFSTTIDQKLLHSSRGFDSLDGNESQMNHSFRSEEQVLILNPCDLSRISDSSAKEAIPIYDAGQVIINRGASTSVSSSASRDVIDSAANNVLDEINAEEKAKILQ